MSFTMENFYECKDYSDFHIVCKDKTTLYFNKQFAAIVCDYLKTKIEFEIKSGNTGLVVLNVEYEQDVVTCLLNMLIFNEVCIDDCNVIYLVELAHEFNISLGPIDDHIITYCSNDFIITLVNVAIKYGLLKTMKKIAQNLPIDLKGFPSEIIELSPKYKDFSGWINQNPTLDHDNVIKSFISRSNFTNKKSSLMLRLILGSNSKDKLSLIAIMANKLSM